MRVKYVLATHEHGDHTPGAYLWRVVTGAKFVAAREAAYTMQHHIPMGTGYGFHPPIATDVAVILLASRHKGWNCLSLAGETVKHPSLEAWLAQLKGSYADLRELDVNGDGRTDLLSSYGLAFLRRADGTFPSTPTLSLPPAKNDWTLMGAGDFNGDHRPDVVLLAHGMAQAKLALHLNTGSADVPYRPDPDAAFDLSFADEPARRRHLLRASPTVGDFNGDGVDDLILAKAKTHGVLILLGGSGGLSPSRSISPEIEFLLHHETRLRLAEFDADGDADLAAFGYTEGTAPGFGYGPLAMFVWLQP